MKLFLIFCLLIITNNSLSQYFEGKVVYVNEYTSKIKGLSDDQLTGIMGDTQYYYIKNGNYKSILNGQVIPLQIYDAKSNRLYSESPKSDTLLWFNASKNTDPVYEFSLKPKVEVILHKMCDALIMNTRLSTTSIYFSIEYKLNPDYFKDHHYNNWAFYLEKSQAIPLKSIVETDQFRLISTAVEIKPMKLPDSFFTVRKP